MRQIMMAIVAIVEVVAIEADGNCADGKKSNDDDSDDGDLLIEDLNLHLESDFFTE